MESCLNADSPGRGDPMGSRRCFTPAGTRPWGCRQEGFTLERSRAEGPRRGRAAGAPRCFEPHKASPQGQRLSLVPQPRPYPEGSQASPLVFCKQHWLCAHQKEILIGDFSCSKAYLTRTARLAFLVSCCHLPSAARTPFSCSFMGGCSGCCVSETGLRERRVKSLTDRCLHK